MIWLAILTNTNEVDSKEYHIRFEGHKTVDAAKAEIAEIRKRLLKDEKVPLDCYVYEAEEPLYGNAAYNLDDIDFNFYRDLTPEEKIRKAKVEKEIEDKMNAAAAADAQ